MHRLPGKSKLGSPSLPVNRSDPWLSNPGHPT